MYEFRMSWDQDPLQLRAYYNGDEAVINLEHGYTLLSLHGQPNGELSWPDRYIRLHAPDMIACCFPSACKEANPQFADKIVGTWQEITVLNLFPDGRIIIGPESEVQDFSI